MNVMSESKWYVAFPVDDIDNEYGKFSSENDALKFFFEWAENSKTEIAEIYECDNDECLTPTVRVWPPDVEKAFEEVRRAKFVGKISDMPRVCAENEHPLTVPEIIKVLRDHVRKQEFFGLENAETTHLLSDTADALERLVEREKFHAFIWTALGFQTMRQLEDMYHKRGDYEEDVWNV